MTSCGDSDPKDVNVTFQMKVGDDALNHSTTYTINNTAVQFTNVAFYLGGLEFELSDGTKYGNTNEYTIIRPGTFDFNFSITENLDQEVSLSKINPLSSFPGIRSRIFGDG